VCGWSAAAGPGAWQSGGRHCLAGQYGYVLLGQHLVLVLNVKGQGHIAGMGHGSLVSAGF